MRETAELEGMGGAGALRTATLELSAALGVGLLLAAVGPYGTFGQAPIAERLVYWIAVILIAFVVYRPACAVAARFARSIGLSSGFGWAAAVIAASFPVTLLVWLASWRHTPSLWPSLPEYVGFYGSVFLIGAGLMLVIWLVDRASAPAAVTAPGPAMSPRSEAAPPAQPALLRRLPAKLEAPIVALEMEDHYVRVHTERGSTLLLMRMRDAVAELDGLEGAQVHRSWWVARNSIEAVERDGRRITLRLRTGIEVPVSRERRGMLPGWLLERLG
jgi:hypothetical protein